MSSLEDSLLDESAKMAKRLSEYSFLSVQSYLPMTAAANSTAITETQPPHIPFIDECASVIPSEVDDEDEDVETEARKNSACSSLVGGHNFCSDSGFSSELCDSSLSRSTKSNSFRRATKWTSSFRKLIRRVSLRKQPNATS